MPLFRSFLQAGFECADITWPRGRMAGRRQDLIRQTVHMGCRARRHYRIVREHGMITVRDGFPWSQVALLGPQLIRHRLAAAAETDMEPVWDLVHFGFPNGIDPFSPDFPDHVARFAVTVARTHEHGTLWLCPVNEPSVTAHFCGQAGQWAPAKRRRGHQLKRNLARATIETIKAVRKVRPDARFLHTDPLSGHPFQFQALEMVAGRVDSKLGGSPELIDVVGLNFYPHFSGVCLRKGLIEARQRFGRPVIVAETSWHTGWNRHETPARAGWTKSAWLRYVLAECASDGAEVEGVCWYPVIDSPPWNRSGPRWSHGLISATGSVDPDLSGELGRLAEARPAQAGPAQTGPAHVASPLP